MDVAESECLAVSVDPQQSDVELHRVEEHEADVCYGMVRYYVASRKPEILVESGKAPLESFVPQNHQPGHEAEFP